MKTQNEILEYIKQKSNNGVLLVTGKWGCGKTHLIRQIVSNLNNGNEFVATSISLFGMDSIKSLHDEIKNKVFFSRGFEKAPKKFLKHLNKVKDFALISSSILSEHFKIAKSVNAALSVRWQDFFFVEKYISCYCDVDDSNDNSKNESNIIKKELVLFFDDFERCKIDIIDLMGAINEYSENKNIKVVIIADEDKIEANEQKHQYVDFKEKLISRTIQIKLDYISAIKSIVDTYSETTGGYKIFLEENIEIISEIFVESKVENLRSVISFITDYERVYDVWHNSNVPLDMESKVFYMFGAMMFGAKRGFYKEGEYGFIFSDLESKDKFSKWSSTYELYSIQNWIVKGVWNKQEFLDEIQRKFNPTKLDDEQKFLSFSFWDLEQSNIDHGLPKAVNNAYNGNLTRDQLINLLQKIHAMKEYSIPLPCEVNYLKMHEGFCYRKELVISNQIKEPERHRFSEKEGIDAQAYNLYKDIENFDKKLYTLEPRNRFIGYLNFEPGISEYEFRGKIIGCFDKELLDLFCESYLKSDNAHKRDMCFVLMDLRFTDEEYMTIEERKETINNFKKLIETICNSEQNESDYITSAINKEFSKKIIEMIKRIERVDAE